MKPHKQTILEQFSFGSSGDRSLIEPIVIAFAVLVGVLIAWNLPSIGIALFGEFDPYLLEKILAHLHISSTSQGDTHLKCTTSQ